VIWNWPVAQLHITSLTDFGVKRAQREVTHVAERVRPRTEEQPQRARNVGEKRLFAGSKRKQKKEGCLALSH
jgi:hypothetical protein